MVGMDDVVLDQEFVTLVNSSVVGSISSLKLLCFFSFIIKLVVWEFSKNDFYSFTRFNIKPV